MLRGGNFAVMPPVSAGRIQVNRASATAFLRRKKRGQGNDPTNL